MEASGADRKKGRFKRHVFYGFSVRQILLLLFFFSQLKVPSYRWVTDVHHSICIITLVRIEVITHITAQNAAGQYALTALLTCLESSLGVVNACLPVTKPVFEKLKSKWLISAISEWTSGKRSVPSHEYEMPSKAKEIGWPLENQAERVLQGKARDSTIDLETVVWTPPSSPRKEFGF